MSDEYMAIGGRVFKIKRGSGNGGKKKPAKKRSAKFPLRTVVQYRINEDEPSWDRLVVDHARGHVLVLTPETMSAEWIKASRLEKAVDYSGPIHDDDVYYFLKGDSRGRWWPAKLEAARANPYDYGMERA